MSRRTEVCREFVRGNCRFGSRCKFFHDTSQQQRQQPSSPFGFGAKSQGQHQPTFNKGGNYYAPLTSSQRKEKAQPQTPIKEHRCTDLRECKLQIKEDLENEQPVFWRLTCYAHGKYLANDVGGDVSFEELRAHAYAAGKQGVPFDSVVQNERSMLAAKKKEFDDLLKNPSSGPTSSVRVFHGNTIAQQEASKMSFGTATPSFASPPFGSSEGPLQNSSQSRSLFGSSAVKDSGGFSFGLGAPSGAAVTVPTSVPILSQSLPAPGFSFGMRSTEPGAFMQGSSPQSAFGSRSLPFSGFGQDYSQFSPNFGHSNAASHSLFGSSIPTKIVQENEMSNSLFPSQNSQPFGVTHVLDTSMNQFMTEVTNQNTPAGLLSQQLSGPSNDKADIWLKETWTLGEIPEEEPPLSAR